MNINDLKILIIEDELIFAKQLESWLKKKVSEVFVATNSESGTFYLSQEKPDVIFLDNQLPGVNGIDVIEFYKEKAPDSILVLMSSVFRLEEIVLALKNKADYIFNKRNESEFGLNAILQASVKTKNTGSPFWKIVELNAPEDSNSAKEIVILEDEEMFSFQMSMILNNLPSYNKHTISRFSSLAEFLDYQKDRSAPDVLFLGFRLGHEIGHEVIKLLNGQQKKCKTIVISPEVNVNAALNLNLDGVSEFIFKDKNWQESIRECAEKLNF